MDRRGFLRRFGIGAAAVAAAPSIARAVVEPTEPTVEHIDHAPPEHTPDYETVTNVPDSEYYTDGDSLWTKSQLEADYLLHEALDRELWLGTGQVTEQSLKGIFR